MKQTPFFNAYGNQAKIVNFGSWQLPVNFGSQINEHNSVRQDCGMFDVSHMTIIDLQNANNFLRYLLSNDINKLIDSNKNAFYSLMLNENAGIKDDLIVYKINEGFRIVTNANTYEKDVAWIKEINKKFNANITFRDNLAMIAIQGPNTFNRLKNIFPEISEQLLSLQPFTTIEYKEYFIAFTGYTGEIGVEIILPKELAGQFWKKCLENNITPCGLGARDTLRIEAGMNLYGHDITEYITPLDVNLNWCVDIKDQNRDFIGKTKYLNLKSNQLINIQMGIINLENGILREGQELFIGANEMPSGTITSGTFSPTLNKSIAFAIIDYSLFEQIKDDLTAKVKIRDNFVKVKLTKLPFIKNGKILINL